MKTSLFTCVIATLAVISANAQTPTPAPTPTAPGRVGGGSVTPVRPVPRGATPGAVNPGTVPGGNPLNPLPGSLIAPVAGNPPGANTAQGANNNAQGANAGASNSVAFNGTNGPGLTISNNVFVTNLFGFNTNMLGVFSNRDNLANGIRLGNSNSQAFAGPNNAIVNGSNAVLERVGNKLMGKFITTNTPSSQGMIQDLALTPTDQAIISRVRQVVQPQNNTVNSGSVTPVHLVVQN